MARIFRYDGRDFPDPSPNLTVSEVQEQLAAFFPEITGAQVRESKEADNTVYSFQKRVGTKGTHVHG